MTLLQKISIPFVNRWHHKSFWILQTNTQQVFVSWMKPSKSQHLNLITHKRADEINLLIYIVAFWICANVKLKPITNEANSMHAFILSFWTDFHTNRIRMHMQSSGFMFLDEANDGKWVAFDTKYNCVHVNVVLWIVKRCVRHGTIPIYVNWNKTATLSEALAIFEHN